MIRVIVESPFKGDEERNEAYLVACLWDCIGKGEAPYASHMFFTQFMDDSDKSERSIGIRLGLEIARVFDMTVAYVDLGISRGMQAGIDSAISNRRPVIKRRLFLNTPTTEEISTLSAAIKVKAIERSICGPSPF